VFLIGRSYERKKKEEEVAIVLETLDLSSDNFVLLEKKMFSCNCVILSTNKGVII
jgi:hypothetical protein